MPSMLPTRAELPDNRKWDESSVFADRAAWDAACAEVLQGAEAIRRLAGTLGKGADALAGYLEESERIESLLVKIDVYTTLLTSVDAADEAAAAMADRAQGIEARWLAAASFAEPELIAIGLDTVRAWIESDPRLGRYAHWVDRLARHAQHVRSAEVEEVLGLAGDPLHAPAMAHA
ncbi:MAG: oligoendopeptidase F, partial [Candidatus Dormibacteraceae bacterium]